MQQRDFRLDKRTTFRIGGVVDLYWEPESVTELLDAVAACRRDGTKIRIIGKGSNLLVSDKRIRGVVFNLEKCSSSLTFDSVGHVTAGAGVPLSRFILRSIEENLYGNEYLSSVPGTVGGAICMNAGTWIDRNLFISDYLLEVAVFDGERCFSLSKEECQFGYRSSIFQRRPDYIILEAKFELPRQDKVEGMAKRRQQLAWSKQSQDLRFGNAGSIFSKCNGHILGCLKGLRLGRAGWSSLTGNWINNYGNASFNNVMLLIKFAQLANLAVGTRPNLELVVWPK